MCVCVCVCVCVLCCVCVCVCVCGVCVCARARAHACAHCTYAKTSSTAALYESYSLLFVTHIFVAVVAADLQLESCARVAGKEGQTTER